MFSDLCLAFSVLPNEYWYVPYHFTAGFTLMWDGGGANGFDVVTGSTQNIHSQYTSSVHVQTLPSFRLL